MDDLGGVVQLGGGVVALAFHAPHSVEPAGHALVEAAVVTQAHVEPQHVAQKLGDFAVDLVDGEGLIGAEALSCAFGPRTAPVPDLHHLVALGDEHDEAVLSFVLDQQRQ